MNNIGGSINLSLLNSSRLALTVVNNTMRTWTVTSVNVCT